MVEYLRADDPSVTVPAPLSEAAQAELERTGEALVMACSACGVLNLVAAEACQACGLPWAPKGRAGAQG